MYNSSSIILLIYLQSYRGKHVGQDHCIDTQSPDVNRFSAELTSVSLLKVQFDILQLRYIALQDKTSAQRIAHYILPKVQQINKALRTSRKYAIPNAKKQVSCTSCTDCIGIIWLV